MSSLSFDFSDLLSKSLLFFEVQARWAVACFRVAVSYAEWSLHETLAPAAML
jgi:hypothetical protein